MNRASSQLVNCLFKVPEIMVREDKVPRDERRRGRLMRLGEPAKDAGAINITPLVDVVLVLLIIFMVMAPQLRKGPRSICRTRRSRASRATREARSWSRSTKPGVWINDKPVAPEHFVESLRSAAGAEEDPRS